MGWWRRTPSRRTVSGPDPVGRALAEAVADGPLEPRFEEEELRLEDLRDWVEVRGDEGVAGFDTVVLLADEIASYTDAAEDGLDAALADQAGIDDVFAEDREVVYLRTALALEDVRAAVVRAVVEVNRSPRPPVTPPGEVTDEQAHALADEAAPVLGAAGFVRKAGDARNRSYFHRVGEDGFVQAVSLGRGLGRRSDGTDLHGTVAVYFGVRVPETARDPLPSDLRFFAVGHCTMTNTVNSAPAPSAVLAVLTGEILPWLEATRSRAALARWVSDDPERIFPPDQRPLHARLFAEWGHPRAARVLLDHLRRRYGKTLSRHPDAQAAGRLLADR